MTLNELIQQLRDYVAEHPEAGNMEVTRADCEEDSNYPLKELIIQRWGYAEEGEHIYETDAVWPLVPIAHQFVDLELRIF